MKVKDLTRKRKIILIKAIAEKLSPSKLVDRHVFNIVKTVLDEKDQITKSWKIGLT